MAMIAPLELSSTTTEPAGALNWIHSCVPNSFELAVDALDARHPASSGSIGLWAAMS